MHYRDVGNWNFSTRHTRVLLCIARDPGARLREIAASLGITERSAYAIVTDLTEAARYVAKQKAGRRNRYQIQAHLPLPGADGRQRTVGGLADLLAEPCAMSRAEPGCSWPALATTPILH